MAKSNASSDSLRANFEAWMTSLQDASGRKIETGETKAPIEKGMTEALGVLITIIVYA